MKVHKNNIYHRLSRIVTGGDLDLPASDPRLKSDFLRNNIIFSIAASILLCIIALIGVIGTNMPFGGRYILPVINATVVYLLIFLINLVFLRLLLYEQRKPAPEMNHSHARLICHLFMNVNMVLASLTFFTTQENSSFFFEYILITAIVYLVPCSDIPSFVQNAVFNILPILFVLIFSHHVLAWQDLVDIVALHIICAFVNWIRWLSFLRTEAVLFSVENKKDLYYTRSLTDALTSLLNRYALRKDFSGYVNQKLCVALIDLDSFKKSNDTYGHDYGDRILEQTGKNLKSAFHDYGDRCYRYGGDEFLVITRDSSRLFYQKLKQFRNLCEDDRESGDNGSSAHISCSIGYCTGIPHSESELRTLIKIADDYLYKAKNEGRDGMKGRLSLTDTSLKLAAEQLSSSNRIISMDDAAKLFAQNNMSDKAWSIAYLNVNRYSEINEALGFRNSQILLEKIRRTVLRHFPDSVLVNRELDHFVLYAVLPDAEFTQQVRRVQTDVAGLESRRMVILRAGIYHHHESDAPADFLTGMYNARYASNQANDVSTGDNYLRVYDEELEQKRTKEAFVHSNFMAALDAGNFVPYYQPIVGSLSGTTYGFEALSRWIDPDRGIIPPGDYVPYLEESSEAYRLDLYLLEHVCRDIHKYKDRLPSRLFVNVNLSQTDFKIMNMPDEIERIVSKYQIPKEQIQFEITESAFAEKKLIHDAVKLLNKRGYRVWMDDFGIGQSSLSAFNNYEVQGVKIDQSFFADLASQRTKIIIRSIVELCHETGSLMIAEGVETAEQLWYAQQWGMNFIQGFFFSKPLPLGELLNSPFIKNKTDEATDRFYQTAAEVSLSNNFLPRSRSPHNQEQLRFARAVIVQYPDQSLNLLRINTDMQELVKDSVVTFNRYQYSLREDFSLTLRLREVIQKIDAQKPTRDFTVELNGRKYYGRLSLLAQKSNDEMTSYLLSLANFVIAS